MTELVALETDRSACIADAVSVLADALAAAERGEVIAAAVVLVRPDLGTRNAYSRTDNLPTLVGGAAILSARLIAASL